MESLLTYIIQVNLLLALLYLGYYFLLRGLTFYQMNRLYLLLGSMYAFVYPFWDVKSWFMRYEVIPAQQLPDILSLLASLSSEEVKEAAFTLTDSIIAVMEIVAAVFFFRSSYPAVELKTHPSQFGASTWNSYSFRNVLFPVVPFSFFDKIYVHRPQHKEKELYDIFAHESVHVRGIHTLDILTFEIILILCWYNPFVWLIRKAVRQNLEFLTDQQVLNKGVDKQKYQYSLLHVTQNGLSVDVSTRFNFKILKKRIMMMNKKRSSKVHLGKYAFLLPILLMAGASFSVEKADQVITDIVRFTGEIPLVAVEVPEDTIIIKSKGTVKQIITPDTGILVDFKTLSVPEPPVIKIDGRDSLISALTIMRNDNIKALTKSFDAKRLVDSVKGAVSFVIGDSAFHKKIYLGATAFPSYDAEAVKKLTDSISKSMAFTFWGNGEKFFINDKQINLQELKSLRDQSLKIAMGALANADSAIAVTGFRLRGNKNPRGNDLLYVVDENVMKDNFELSDLAPEEISSITIHKRG
ncbi:M56 family metallopeptidase [Sphingobacterium sp. T2]|uniref:M56 family metallopeptidase n=1 Tax=Sphingobacterium sp. T2 TaxID=1590596 RepID=UPI00057B9BD3|nr:M56 family metallopeptidase [Sphingobacterium sp. T2]